MNLQIFETKRVDLFLAIFPLKETYSGVHEKLRQHCKQTILQFKKDIQLFSPQL